MHFGAFWDWGWEAGDFGVLWGVYGRLYRHLLKGELGNYSWGLGIDYYRYISKPVLLLHLSIWKDLSDTDGFYV